MELKGTVKENGELYRVRILSKGSQIYDYSLFACRINMVPGRCAVRRRRIPGQKRRFPVSGLVSSCESLV